MRDGGSLSQGRRRSSSNTNKLILGLWSFWAPTGSSTWDEQSAAPPNKPPAESGSTVNHTFEMRSRQREAPLGPRRRRPLLRRQLATTAPAHMGLTDSSADISVSNRQSLTTSSNIPVNIPGISAFQQQRDGIECSCNGLNLQHNEQPRPAPARLRNPGRNTATSKGNEPEPDWKWLRAATCRCVRNSHRSTLEVGGGWEWLSGWRGQELRFHGFAQHLLGSSITRLAEEESA